MTLKVFINLSDFCDSLKSSLLSSLLQRSLVLAPGRGKGWEQGCACCAFSSHPAGGSVPPGRDKGTGNVILLLEGVREELPRAVFARGYLSAFAMILCSNGTELLGGSSTDTSLQTHSFHLPCPSSDPTS